MYTKLTCSSIAFCECDSIMMNSAVCAMKMLQIAMEGEAEKTGLNSDDDVVTLIMEMRSEETE